MIKRIINGIAIKIKNRINPKSELEILIERGLKIGKNFNFFNSTIDYGHYWLVEVGDDVTITNSTILAHDASTKLELGKSKIGNRVFIGYGSIILCNVNIGDDVIIAAESVVTKDIENNSILGGNTARVIGKKMNIYKRFLEEKNVYDTYWPYKNNSQISIIQSELDNDFGYDE